jgi:hypothetical protein
MAGRFPSSFLLKHKRNPGRKSSVLGFKHFVLKKSGIKIEGVILKCLKFRDQGMKFWFCLWRFY